ncbi:hypothetical protein D7Y41_13500 [Anaerotruncus sp. 1XD22-93]|nr:hypothetical protein D7Y41_13500 [Anaerotruncus sp. 1XD22-93]
MRPRRNRLPHPPAVLGQRAFLLAGEWLPERGIHACVFMLACEPAHGSPADIKNRVKSCIPVSFLASIYAYFLK